MFSTLVETNFNFSVTFILLFSSAVNLDQSKNLSFGKGLEEILEATQGVINASSYSYLAIVPCWLPLSVSAFQPIQFTVTLPHVILVIVGGLLSFGNSEMVKHNYASTSNQQRNFFPLPQIYPYYY